MNNTQLFTKARWTLRNLRPFTIRIKNRSTRFLIIFCLNFCLTTGHLVAQAAFKLQVEAGETLDQVLKELGLTYDLTFSYPSQLGQTRIDRSLDRASAELVDLLDELLTNQDIAFQQTGPRTILLRPERKTEENTTILYGQVFDAYREEPLANAIVQLSGANLGTYTEEDGSFFLDPKQPITAEDTLIIRSLGFAERRIPGLAFAKNQRIVLEPSPLELREILVVEPLNRLRVQSVDRFGQSLTSRRTLAGGTSQLIGRDVFRQLQLLPGIFSANDQSAALRIRGSTESETYILLDGIPLYHSDHYYGIFSGIQADWVKDISVYPNNLPVAYDGRTGGMVFLEAPDFIAQPALSLDLNTLTGALRAAMPLGGGWQVQLGGRTTWQSVSDAPLFSTQATDAAFTELIDDANSRRALLTLQPDFRYYDLNAQVSYLGKGSLVKASYYRNADLLDNSYSLEYRTRENRLSRINTESFLQDNIWYSEGVSLQWEQDIRPNSRLLAEAYYSFFQEDAFINTTFQQRRARQETPIRDLSFRNVRFNDIEEVGGRIWLQTETNWQVGFSATVPHSTSLLIQDSSAILYNSEMGAIGAFFAARRWENDKGYLEIGGRFSYYDLDNNFRLAPRIQGKHNLSEQLKVKASIGRHFQYLRELNYENRLGESRPFWVVSGTDLFPVGESWNGMLGLEFTSANWRIDLEVYHKKPLEVVELAAVRPSFRDEDILPGRAPDFRVFTGNGRIWGGDLLITYKQESWSSQLAYTLSKNQQRFREIARNQWFAAPDDRRHQLSWTSDYHWKAWSASATYTYSSGRPYTNLPNLLHAQDRRMIDPADRQARLPAYHRLDAGIEWAFETRKGQGALGLSVFNITDRANVAYRQFILSVPVQREQQTRNEILGAQSGLLPRTVSLNARWAW